MIVRIAWTVLILTVLGVEIAAIRRDNSEELKSRQKLEHLFDARGK